MAHTPEKHNISSFTNPLETFPGLTIEDLNKYLPAIRTVEDIKMNLDNMSEGMFLTKCLDGLKQLPDESIDLIIADPPKDNWDTSIEISQSATLQEYYQWNHSWLCEAYRVLKNTGSLYIFSPWEYSGMYHGLLHNVFIIQSRIIWRNYLSNNENDTWLNETSDIWFATKTNEFLFKQHPVGVNTIKKLNDDFLESNLWLDIPKIVDEGGRYPQPLFSKIIESSSFNLNWILDPFMRVGDVGVACKKSGRRFIGFETNKDQMLLSMKRVDKT